MKTWPCGGRRDGNRKLAPQAFENARFTPENGMGSERFDHKIQDGRRRDGPDEVRS